MSYQSTYSQHNKHLSSSNTFTIKFLFFSAPSKSLHPLPEQPLSSPLRAGGGGGGVAELPPTFKTLSSAPSKSLHPLPVHPPFNYLSTLAETNVINSMRAIVLYFFIIYKKIYF